MSTDHNPPEQRQAVADAEGAMFAAAEKCIAVMQPLFTPARRAAIEQLLAEVGELRAEVSVDGVRTRRVSLSVVTANGHREEIGSFANRPQPRVAP